LYEKVTGKSFDRSNTVPIRQRIEQNVLDYLEG
jgi:hypothetical protein